MKQALLINAIFSGFSGIALISFQNWFASLFGLNSATAFWIVGVALGGFAATILYEMTKLNRTRILWIITQDLIWVAASVYLLTGNPFSISKSGNIAIALVALIVLLMAINQYIALRKVKSK